MQPHLHPTDSDGDEPDAARAPAAPMRVAVAAAAAAADPPAMPPPASPVTHIAPIAQPTPQADPPPAAAAPPPAAGPPRSLSADELNSAAALPAAAAGAPASASASAAAARQYSAAAAAAAVAPASVAAAERPARGGLLGRLRKALRGNAAATRARASGSAAPAAGAPPAAQPAAHPAARSRAFGFGGSKNAPGHGASKESDVDFDAARGGAPLPPPPPPPPSVRNSRRFLGSRDRSGRVSSGLNQAALAESAAAPGLSASQPLSGAAFQAGGEPSPSASTGNIQRALPKTRVFSSPPSFSFGFGSRRKLSLAGNKQGDPDGGGGGGGVPGGLPKGATNVLAEGDSGSLNKLNRTFNNRGVFELGRGSGNLSLMTVAKAPGDGAIHVAPDRNAVALRTTLNAVMAGHAPFTALLDAMFLLEERLPPDTKDTLIKYLSKPDHITALIQSLTVVVPVVSEDEGVLGPGGERVRYRHSYVSSMLLSNGPIQLRRSLFLSPKHLDRLVGVLGHGAPTDAVVVRSVCKVLLSVLRDSPEDTVRAMVRRSDFLDALLSHISVTGCPEVCLSMLSTVRCQAELKFGPPNKPIVGVMADASLLHTLCARLAVAAQTDPIDGAASSAIENCSRVIVGIALRALVIPRFEVNDDESDAEYMTKFNRDLASLDVFHQPEPILRLLDSGFEALKTHDERGYALSTALTAVRYLMVTAINGQDASLSAIRMQLLSVNTSAYEAGIRERVPALAAVLQTARRHSHVQTMWSRIDAPLGVVRLKVLELVVVLLQHGNHETAQSLVDAAIPRTLMDLFARLELNSLLQHFVATIVEHSFRMSSPALRKAFFLDVNLIDMIMYLWRESQQRERTRKSTPVNNLGEMSRIAVAMRDFLANTSSPEVRQMCSWLGEERVAEFAQFCDGPVAEHDREGGQLLGGIDQLPHRIDEDGGFGDSIFFRPRSGSSAVEA